MTGPSESGMSKVGPNPYVGPRSFEEDEEANFFGRDEETAILEGLVMARRATLFFAQSGAGKSSLLKAGLIPRLTRQMMIGRGKRQRIYQKMQVLPVASVGGAPPENLSDPVANIYVFNALFSLNPQADPETLAGQTLSAGLAASILAEGRSPATTPASSQEVNDASQLPSDEPSVMSETYQQEDTDASTPSVSHGPDISPSTPKKEISTLFILDQFEELFTQHLTHWLEREDFFRQVGQALRDQPDLRVLFTMREDYIAELTPFAHLLPDELRSRFRLEPLSRDAALLAVREPAALSGRSYAPGVAEGLVDNLRRIQTGRKDAQYTLAPTDDLGTTVEPVHLQIVCRQLWDSLPPDKTTIEWADVQSFGDVDQALISFYDQTLARVASQTDYSQRRLRVWFEEKLITPARTRSLVYRDETETEELPNSAVDLLNDAYLIRATIRGRDTWYELAHDRLVEPILTSNFNWRTTYQNPLASTTQAWLMADRDPQKLLDGAQLAEAQAFAEANPGDVLQDEAIFLAESERAEERRQEQAHQQAQRRRLALAVGLVVILVLAGLAFLALRSAAEARRQESIAVTQEAVAQQQREIAQQNEAEAERQKEEALRQAKLAQSRELAAAAVANLALDPERSLLLALEALVPAETDEAEDALRLALQASRIEGQYEIPGNDFKSVIFTPDGERLAAAGSDGRIYLWQLSVGDPDLTVIEPEDAAEIWDMAFSLDGTLLVSAHADATARIWDVESGELLTTLAEHILDVLSVAFTPDGQRIVTGSQDRTARVWDADTGQEAPPRFFGHGAGITDVAVSPKGDQLATAGQDGTVKLWDLETGEELHTLEGHLNEVWTVAFSPDGRRVATGSLDKTVVLWDVSGGEPTIIYTFFQPTDTVVEVEFSPNGQCLAGAGLDRVVRIWEVVSGELLYTLTGHEDWVYDATFEPLVIENDADDPETICGRQLATASSDGSVRLWNVGLSHEGPMLLGHTEPVESAVFNSDGERIASADDDGIGRVWDVASGAVLFELIGHEDRINQIAFSPDDAYLATASYDGTARLWDGNTGNLIAVLGGHKDRLESLAFDPEGKRLATASDDGTARIWKVPSGRLIDTLGHGFQKVYGVVFNPDGSILVTTGEGGNIKVWDLSSDEEPLILKHGATVYDAAFAPDGKLLVTAGYDGHVKTWSMPDGKLEAEFTAHTDRVYGLDFSPDGLLLATSGADGAIKVWDTSTGKLLLELSGPEFNRLDFSPDGLSVVVGGEDETVRIYYLGLDDLLRLAAKRVTRSLTEEECQEYLHLEQCPTEP